MPDYQGYFLRGYGGNSAYLGYAQSDAIRNITGNIFAHMAGNDRTLEPTPKGVFQWTYPSKRVGFVVGQGNGAYQVDFNASNVVPTANENRPVNKAVRYLIRAKS